jgi:hypothetical protein
MRDFINRAGFVIPMWPGVGMLMVTTVFALLLIMGGRDITVRTANAACVVGETRAGSERITVGLRCQEGDAIIETSTADASTVLEIIRRNPTSIVCDVEQSGWVSRCRIDG